MTSLSLRPRFFVGTAAVFVLGLHACLFAPALFGGETFVVRDLRAFHRPSAKVLVSLVRAAGWPPEWNPLSGSGRPFAANPLHAAFHPFTSLFFLMPFEWAFRLQVILPVLISSAAMWLLLRTLRRSLAAALFGTIAWTLGGALLSNAHFLPALFTLCLLPAVLAFALRVLRGARSRDAVLLAAAFGFEALGGEPVILVATFVLLAACVAHELGRLRGRAGRSTAPRRLAALCVALVIGLGLAVPVWWPALHLFSRSVRAVGLSEEAATSWSFPLIRAVELVVPGILGDLERPSLFWGAALYSRQQRFPFLLSIYPGALATILAIVGWVRGGRRNGLWALVAALGILLAAGSHLPFFSIARRVLPGLSAIRYPEKFLIMTLLALVVSASAGVDLMRARRTYARRDVVLALWLVAAAALVFAEASPFSAALLDWLGGGSASPAAQVRHLDRELLSAALVAALCAVLLMCARWMGGRRVAMLVSLVLAAELSMRARPLVRTRPIADVSRPPAFLRPVIDAPPSGPLFLYGVTIADSLASPVRDLEDAIMPMRWGLATTFDGDMGMAELSWSDRATRAFWELLQKDGSMLGPMIARRGVAAVVMPRPDMEGGTKLELAFTRARQPFAFLADHVELVEDDRDWMRVVERLGPRAASTVCFERDHEGTVDETPSGGSVRRVDRGVDRVEIHVDVAGPKPGVLAVNQTWDVAWKAWIDGARVPVRRADLALSAVVVPPGRHVVELRYRDWTIRAGLALFVASALALVLLACRGRASAWPTR